MIFGIFFYFIIYIIGQAQLSSINVIISYMQCFVRRLAKYPFQYDSSKPAFVMFRWCHLRET